MIPTSWLYKILGGAIAVAALLWLIQSRDHWRDTAKANEQMFHAEQAAHASTVANYRAATEQAKRDDAANAARVKAEQAAINQETSDEFEARIADARDRARRLQQQADAAKADSGGRGTTPVPGVPPASSGADEAAGQGGLSRSDALIATEQAIQLDELIKWVKRQAGVEVNGQAPSSPPPTPAAPPGR